MHFVAAQTVARTERFHGPEDLVLEPPPALEIRLLSPQILEELPDESAHRRVQLGRLDASPAINIFRYRDRDILHRYTITQFHSPPEERLVPVRAGGRGSKCGYRPDASLAKRRHMPYYGNMKSKTSITLSKEVVEAVDRLTPKGGSRSETIERLLRESFVTRERRARDLKDLEILNRRAEELNEEAEDVLTFQVEI
jgi:Arc/MetJ-type ribon-helix-helix transcriptional regulator